MHSMHTTGRISKPDCGTHGLTLVELMVTVAVFSMAMLALISTHIFGLRQDELIQSKLGASDESRRGFDRITRDIRSAKIWRLGSFSGGTFTGLTNGAQQQGSALQLSYTNSYSTNVTYYFTTVNGDNQLCRLHTGESSTVIASNLINTLSFTAEDYRGNVATDLQWRYVLHFILQFRQFQYPLTKVGPTNLYDFYKMEFRVTPHAPD